jgi:DMSO reductase anchor subunit
MKASFSLILFTVLSGAGYGLFSVTVMHDHFATSALGDGERGVAVIIALLLTVTGLISSVFHLANKKNAWKAFSRFRTSWLSREAVFAVLFFIPALLYLAGTRSGGDRFIDAVQATGLTAVVLAVATVVSTSMIYASLKTIRQWHNPLVPVNYLLLSLTSGMLLLAAIRGLMSQQAATLLLPALVLLVTALVVKTLYYFWIGKPAASTLNTALAIGRARIRLLDVGHSHDTFLTEEFGNRVPRALAWLLRALVIAGVYLVPVGLLWYVHEAGGAIWTVAAALVMLAGLLLERWLFLAEGRHVVNLYHGQQRV